MYLIGVGAVIACVAVGYASAGGVFRVLWQPPEYVIILGAAIGAFFISNRKPVIHEVTVGLSMVTGDKILQKKDYIELLSAMFSLFRLARSKGLLGIEPHIDKPYESGILTLYPSFLKQKEGVTFFCDYFRLMTMGLEDPMKMDDLMREEIEMIKHERHAGSDAVQTMADGTPALGIVAAVLGVIITMGSIDQPPAVLGKLIGAALVGTFFGVFVAYGIIGPTAARMKSLFDSDLRYFDCIKAGLLAHMEDLPPQIAVENARKCIEPEMRPSFSEMEEALNEAGEGGG